MNFYFAFIAVLIFFLSAHPVKAVPPPDFIFSVGTQIAQFFTIATVLLSALGSAAFQFYKTRLTGKKRLIFWISVIVAALGLSGTGAWLYGRYVQQQALKQWSAESKQYTQEMTSSTSTSASIDQEPSAGVAPKGEGDNLDQLQFGETIGTTQAHIEQPDDAVATFIRHYYGEIAAHHLEAAYALSKQNVPLKTFQDWYVSTTNITIDKLQRINEYQTSLELTLTEGTNTIRYGVLMDLRLDDSGKPVQVGRSLVRILNQSEPPTVSNIQGTTSTQATNSYFDSNKQLPEAISNSDFQAEVGNPNTKYLILDARENIEFENGHYPDATHIRFADLKAGRWIELPTDQPVYVFCWSGIRGKEVTEFLRSKQILARYLQTGANGWVSSGGKWQGDIAFLKVYTDDRYKRVFSLDEIKKEIAQNVTLVDTRAPNDFAAWHIQGSVNIPLMSTPSISIEQTFAQVAPHSTIITVCDAYVNCFDAKLTGVELERRGNTFLGRFAEPWRLKQP
jgi:rhodanese-related sulfurtransferase